MQDFTLVFLNFETQTQTDFHNTNHVKKETTIQRTQIL